MESINFEFLRETNPELADLGGFAERYVHTDPSSALIKLRLYAENMVADYFQHLGLPHEPRSSFLDYLRNPVLEQTVPSVVLDKFHAIRIHGNRAAHSTGEDVKADTAVQILREGFDLGKWFVIILHAKKDVAKLQFQAPPKADREADTAQQKAAVLQRLAAQEAQMQKLLDELEAERAKAAAAEKTVAEQKEILARANQAANMLHFNEAETRKRLIDQMLVQAGWNVGADGASTPEVGQEIEVPHQPTDSGVGYADYVLYNDDGKPLAIVEAKKTAHDAEKGRVQAKLYADGLEKQYGQRPVIFYTNGHDTRILDDTKCDVPRRVYGFYNKDSLQFAHWTGSERENLAGISPKKEIVDRLYQLETLKRITEHFENKRRKALLVLATGTGKTRVAVALCEMMLRARWIKRVLFLCDRRELRKQANNAFADHLDSEPRTYVTARTSQDRKKTIYLATYPAMMKCFQNFDVGFFDLIIADESHRSIYNRYRDLFVYFDAYQVGLTATPVGKINRNTFLMFDCEDRDPTAKYSYEEAINDTPPYLVPFHVTKHTTKFLREGIKYTQMSPEQQQQLEEQVPDAELVDYTAEQVSQEVFSKDTDRKILRNLMENGVRNPDGTNVGKTIIFARNHNHALQLQRLFDEMYPQYMKARQEFCAVIDNYVDRAEQLIDDFKGEGANPNLTIAISVDMLDTGIDVPEVVNLVFAKPVKSYVKFWQMIGRGTRLCKNLFIDPETGKRKDKEYFQIFDHWGNFEWFGENPPEYEPSVQKSLMQQIFEARIGVAEAALAQQNLPVFELAVELIEKDVNALPDDTISIREKWRQVKTVQQPGAIKKWDAAIVGQLKQEVAPLMQWRVLEGHEDAYRFDLVIGRLQKAHLVKSAQFDDFKDEVLEQVAQLPVNLAQVAAKIAWVDKAKSAAFWNGATVESTDELRRELRGIMHCRNKPKVLKPKPLEIDVTDMDEEAEEQIVRLEGLDFAAYRQRVQGILNELFEESPALQKIKARQPVAEEELRDLAEKVLLRDPNLKVSDLLAHFPNEANRLDLAIRQVIGLDGEAVNRHFTTFAQKYPSLNSHQIRFLELIKKHIATYGALQLERLYDQPFTQIHSEGVDGVFTDESQVDDLLTLITQINELAPAASD